MMKMESNGAIVELVGMKVELSLALHLSSEQINRR